MSSEKTRCGGRWTEGRYKGFITSALRGAYRRWPPKWDTLNAAFGGTKQNRKTKRQAKHYNCSGCGHLFPAKEVQVDHKIPIGHCTTWDEFIEKLYAEADNLQVLCKTCHKKKTKREQQS